MALTLRNIQDEFIHHIILLTGILLPVFLVLSLFTVSQIWEVKAYLRYYYHDFYMSNWRVNFNKDAVAMIPPLEIAMVCWINVDFIRWFLLIPVAGILIINLSVMFTAVIVAYKSATFRWAKCEYVSLSITGMLLSPSSCSLP